MANVNYSLEQETFFPDLVENVRKEIIKRFARALQLLIDREQQLFGQLQLLLDNYREQMREKNTLIERQDIMEQNASLSEQLVEQKLGTARNTYKTITLYWDELLETKLGNIGKVIVGGTNIPNYQMMSQPIAAFGVLSKTNSSAGVFDCPKDIAVDPVTDNIYVTDKTSRVQVFNQWLEFLFFFDTRMSYPTGICVAQDRVYGVQYRADCLIIYSTSGEYLRSIGSRGSAELQFHGPRCVDVSIDRNRIYLTEYLNKRVQCLNLDLSFHSFITNVKRPKCIKLAPNEIVVLCLVIPYLLIYNYAHQLIRKALWTQPDLTPYRLCIDKFGNYVITDECEYCIKVFSQNGELIHQIGARGKHTGQLIKPRGILILHESRIIVLSENPKHVIQMF